MHTQAPVLAQAFQPSQAVDAIRAAKSRKSWGYYMSMGFLRKRNIPHALYRLACQLEAAQKGGF